MENTSWKTKQLFLVSKSCCPSFPLCYPKFTRLYSGCKIDLTLSQTTNFWSLQNSKSLRTQNLKFDENDTKLCKWVENIVGKGEIARCEQFFLFPQSFQKTYCRHVNTRDCLGKG